MKLTTNAPVFLHTFKKYWAKLLDIIYPKECIICGKTNEDILCDKCYDNMFLNNIVKECKIDKYNENYKEHLYIFKYEGKIRNIILDYKFNDKAYLYEFFVKIILKNEKICRKIKKYDIIIPVPIHKKRNRERGYNQSELIARKIAENFENTECIKNCLVKSRNNAKQSSLTKKQRMQNVKGVYKIQNKQKIKNKRVILFDDIYTTGSTVNECAEVLNENGAKEVLVFTIAKDELK